MKYPCFLCYWDSRDKANHWTKKDWLLRDRLNAGKKNVIAEKLVPRDKIVFPLLLIKLGLMKQFVKALYKDKMVIVLSIFVRVLQVWIMKS